MRYITDLFNTHWNDEFEDRTVKVKAEKVRLAENRETQKKPDWPATEESKKASDTYSNTRN